MSGMIVNSRHVAVVILGSVLGILLLTAGTVRAQDGGIVVGRVTFVGDPPPPGEPIEVTTNVEVCGETSQPEDLVVGPDKGLQYAVVRILGAPGSVSVPPEPPALAQTGCRFSPHVVVVGVGQPLALLCYLLRGVFRWKLTIRFNNLRLPMIESTAMISRTQNRTCGKVGGGAAVDRIRSSWRNVNASAVRTV